MTEAPNTPTDLASDWQPWTGGACPVPANQAVEVRRRYVPGTTSAPAGSLRWTHDQYYHYGADDITAYRISVCR